MKKQLTHALRTAAVSAGSLAFGLLFAASAHAAQGDLQSIKLYDTNHNGQIDRIDIAVDNSSLNTWTKNGTPVYGVRYNGNDVTVSSSSLVSAAANPVVIRLALSEADADLLVDTSNALLEVAHTQAVGGGSCTNCFGDVTGNVSAPAIGQDDTGADAEIDYAQPILTSVTPTVNGSGVTTLANVVLNFSEPMTLAFADTTQFTVSPDPGSWLVAWTNSNKTATLSHANLVKSTTYTMTMIPAVISAASGSGTTTLDTSGTLVSLSSDAWSFLTASSNSAALGSVPPYVAPVESCSMTSTPVSESTVNAGDKVTFNWAVSSGIENELLSYSVDGKKTWKAIASFPDTTTTYTWTVPAVEGETWMNLDCREGGGGTLSSAQTKLQVAPAVVVAAPAPEVVPAPIVVPAAPYAAPVMVEKPAPTYTKDLGLGSKGDEVTSLQKFLVAKGLLKMPAGAAHGYFGSLTRTALKKLQAGWHLPITGSVDETTRAALNPKF